MSVSLSQQREVAQLNTSLTCDLGVLANPVLRSEVASNAVRVIHDLLPSGFRHLSAFATQSVQGNEVRVDPILAAVRHEVTAVIDYFVNGTLQVALPAMVAAGTSLSEKHQRAILKRHPGWLTYAPELFTEAACIKGLNRRTKGLDRVAKSISALGAARRDRFDLVNAWLEQQRDTDKHLTHIVMPSVAPE